MTKFLIDENLPYKISIWNNTNFTHVFDIKRGIEDADIWEYAKQKDLIIITKDADFSNKVLSSNWVIHAYDNVDNVIIWGVLNKDVPLLKKQVENLLSQS